METIPATAQHPPWVIVWKAWGLPVALRCASLGDEDCKTVIKKQTSEKPQITIENHCHHSPAPSLGSFVGSLGAASGPPRCQAGW